MQENAVYIALWRHLRVKKKFRLRRSGALVWSLEAFRGQKKNRRLRRAAGHW